MGYLGKQEDKIQCQPSLYQFTECIEDIEDKCVKCNLNVHYRCINLPAYQLYKLSFRLKRLEIKDIIVKNMYGGIKSRNSFQQKQDRFFFPHLKN